MFLLVIVACIGVAVADSEPGFAYSVGAVPVHPNFPVLQYAAPVVYATPVGCQNDKGEFVPCNGGLINPYITPIAVAAETPEVAEAAGDGVEAVERKRREAEPEAEADPYLLYYGGSPYVYAAAAPVVYHHPAYYHHYSPYFHGYHHAYSYFGRKKREAKPEAEPEADAHLLYYGLPYASYAYHAVPYAYAAPYVHPYALRYYGW